METQETQTSYLHTPIFLLDPTWRPFDPTTTYISTYVYVRCIYVYIGVS